MCHKTLLLPCHSYEQYCRNPAPFRQITTSTPRPLFLCTVCVSIIDNLIFTQIPFQTAVFSAWTSSRYTWSVTPISAPFSPTTPSLRGPGHQRSAFTRSCCSWGRVCTGNISSPSPKTQHSSSSRSCGIHYMHGMSPLSRCITMLARWYVVLMQH